MLDAVVAAATGGAGALASFLGGSAFRMVWGEVSSYFQKRQDHANEMEMLSKQAELEAGRHARDCERIRLQSDLKVAEVKVVADAAIQQSEADAWSDAVKSIGRQTGIKLLDAWNGSIRPLLATLAIAVVVAEIVRQGWVLSAWDRDLVAAILGMYVADRTLAKRGK